MNPVTPESTAPSPIADLSYRGYDGPLRKHPARWWIVALAGMRRMFRNQWFWAMTAGAFLPYVFHGIIFYVKIIAGPVGGGGMPGMVSDANGHEYAMVFFQALSSELLWLFGIALLVGAGCIASDNRANALQVYLSKPITKLDYLLGKWMGIFLTVSVVALAPALLTYLALGAACASRGYFTKEPTLILQIVLASLLPGIMHASLLVGFSAWSSSSRVAGALYAAFYFVGEALVGILWLVLHGRAPNKGILLQHLSVGGIITGIAQNVYGITLNLSRFFHRRGSIAEITVPPPNVLIMLAIGVGICVLAIAAARWKIRAVEVVRG